MGKSSRTSGDSQSKATMPITYEAAIQLLTDLRPLISYLEKTPESEWRVKTVRNADNTENCFFGHLVNWAYGMNYRDSISSVWDMFEEMWSTTYQIYPINDGENPDYQQDTPRQRVIAYIKNLWLGLEMDTTTSMEAEFRKYHGEGNGTACAGQKG